MEAAKQIVLSEKPLIVPNEGRVDQTLLTEQLLPQLGTLACVFQKSPAALLLEIADGARGDGGVSGDAQVGEDARDGDYVESEQYDGKDTAPPVGGGAGAGAGEGAIASPPIGGDGAGGGQTADDAALSRARSGNLLDIFGPGGMPPGIFSLCNRITTRPQTHNS